MVPARAFLRFGKLAAISGLGSGGIIRGFVARSPLNITAETRFLVLTKRPSGEQSVYGRSQIRARHRLSIAGAAVVELAPINQLAIPIEQIEFRSAGGGIAFGNGLSFVIADRKVQSQFSGHGLQAFGGIVR